ncbi:DBR1-domain-containing protein [Trametes meyenii]|nr:DBR1-domain-containing protein [Trametes meyenii]
MKIAIEGCGHGELDAIYGEIARLERENGYKVDLLLICGDFQAVRNRSDLVCMAVPEKFKKLGDFAKYYTGKAQAPILTLVIGGNHEASNYFWELYHGGWLAPNIYFLGHAGCIQVNGVRIAGASGIFKPGDYHTGYHERPPYNHGTMRSIYHFREYNFRRLSLLSSPTIFLSHDWPQGIAYHGDLRDLLRRKPYFRDDINQGVLGSPPMMDLLYTLRPAWWFSAHLHCRFEATVVHQDGAAPGAIANEMQSAEKTNPDEINIDCDDEDAPSPTAQISTKSAPEKTPATSRNPDEITLDEEEVEVDAPPPPPPPPTTTRFLALDKCLPHRRFLEVIDVDTQGLSPSPSPPTLAFDPEWLAITRAFNGYMSLERTQHTYPDEVSARAAVRDALDWVHAHVLPAADNAGTWLPCVDEVQQFVITAPGPVKDDEDGDGAHRVVPREC